MRHHYVRLFHEFIATGEVSEEFDRCPDGFKQSATRARTRHNDHHERMRAAREAALAAREAARPRGPGD